MRLSMTPRYLVGIDEVGRGPLAGPVCVGACLIERESRTAVLARFQGVRDSKRLTPLARERWFGRIAEAARTGSMRTAISFVGPAFIDRRGISGALSRAIKRCLGRFALPPGEVEALLDGGIRAPAEYVRQTTLVRGDETEPLIALASIVAKVSRDRRMRRLGVRFPQYGFEKHKGYGTRKHFEAIRKHGIIWAHRQTFLRSLPGSFYPVVT